MEIIVAVYSDWGIGRDGTQPFVIPEDRKHFRELTGSDAVIVGRRTLSDFPGGKPLKGRTNIVLTRSGEPIDGAITVTGVEQALTAAGRCGRTFVIGGASVYRELLPYCDTAHVTMIGCTPESDVFFENLAASPEWYEADSSEPKKYEGVTYRFVTYRRRNSEKKERGSETKPKVFFTKDISPDGCTSASGTS